jgi:hypothetical protein
MFVSSLSARRALMAVAILAALVAPRAVSAQDATTSSAIVPVPNSPATIQSCRITKGNDYRDSWKATITVGNRTTHSLIAADMQFVAYDPENTKFSQSSLHFSGFDAIASRDTGVINANLQFNLAGVADNPALLAKVSCKIVGAQFTSNKKWALGTAWPEPLLNIEAATMIPSDGGQGAAPVAHQAAKPKFVIAVTNAWNDVFPNGILVHDTVTITGGDADAQLRPADLVLTMTLSGGAKKIYPGLAAPAPQYQKIVPGVGTTLAYEVAPAADLGRLGMIVIPAHASVVTTVTFGITDPIATPADNKNVTVR